MADSEMNLAAGIQRGRSVSADVRYKLELSRRKAEKIRTREMHCPVCGMRVQIIPVNQKELVFVKCRKCKFTGPLDPAYFRRMKRRNHSYN
ncbi:MAG: hypothetical protein IJ744_03215 [Lachnospiraceae bacterium]|nr:hypothetical protein [Lachnospiraceae bacterium]